MKKKTTKKGTILWWGHSDYKYSRNSIIRHLLRSMGWEIIDFSPLLSKFGYIEALAKQIPRTDLIWVPVFRQRDFNAAYAWKLRHGIPIIFDPLISAYDKQVFERFKLKENSYKAQKLLAWETKIFQKSDCVIADTSEHEKYFIDQFKLSKEKVKVVYVGADEDVFKPDKVDVVSNKKNTVKPFEILFYGSYIPLQGPQVIVEAASLYKGPEVTWTMVGDGPLRSSCERLAKKNNIKNMSFLPWLDYNKELPKRINKADIVLGIFGDTDKAGRVIPNKVYQTMAIGKPIVTRYSDAYPEMIIKSEGITWIKASSPSELAKAVEKLSLQRADLYMSGKKNYDNYQLYFSSFLIKQQLQEVMGLIKVEKPLM